MPDLQELTSDQARRVCAPEELGFESTEELPALEEVVGQERAAEAIDFGIEMEAPGFNIYVLGPPGAGRTSTLREFVERRAVGMSVPDDWCYVYNFEDPHKPLALRTPPGRGKELRTDMDALVEELKVEIPRVLESEDYQKERAQLLQEIQERQSAVFAELEKRALDAGFSVQRTPMGVAIVPTRDGKAMSQEEYGQLPTEERQRLESEGRVFQQELNQTARRTREIEREARKIVDDLERRVVMAAVGHQIQELHEKYFQIPQVLSYLKRVGEDVLNHIQEFTPRAQEPMQTPMGPIPRPEPSFERYKVNVLVDNAAVQGAPVIVESNPTYPNLIGRIERQVQMGALVTDFTMVKPGALHRANGGFLVVEVEHLLRTPFTWDALKRALRNRQIRISELSEEFSYFSTVSLDPEAIPLDVKVVLIGDPRLYYMLYNMDKEFQELFKVKADFNTWMDRTPENVRRYAQFIRRRCQDENLLDFNQGAVARVVEYGSELMGDQTRLSTKFADICELAQEATYRARRSGGEQVSREDVQEAIDAKIRRASRIEEILRETIERGDVFIDVEGEVVGQVNGLAVMSMGDRMFGKPSRITARTFLGRAGIINIEREVKMSGPIHDKGVLILTGYLNGKYGLDRPISMSASVGFEQSYEGVDGDSASSTELYALLSSLSGFPIKQGIAVTGSVNQRGEIQPIGGVTQKVEGFFDVCRAKGFTGEQGVLIPHTNVKNLMLREEIVEAIREGKFHIWPVRAIDEGIEILTGKPVGELDADGMYPEESVNRAVEDRLAEMADRLREFGEKEEKMGEKDEEDTEEKEDKE